MTDEEIQTPPVEATTPAVQAPAPQQHADEQGAGSIDNSNSDSNSSSDNGNASDHSGSDHGVAAAAPADAATTDGRPDTRRGNRPPKVRNAHAQQRQPSDGQRLQAQGHGGGRRQGEGQAEGQQGRGQRQSAGQGRQGQQQQQRPARQVHPVLEKLFELHPKLFGAHFLPLKLGTYEDLVARHPDVFKTEELKVAMGLHARSTRYLESVAAGLARHDLDGNPVEPVAAEHVHHAIMEVFRRKQARTKDDLRPALQARIIAAIEASGLHRDAYAERVRGRDEVAGAALDEALAELGRQAARREALLRAFEASGKNEAEFADMYGMNPAEVAQTLQRARSDKAASAAAVPDQIATVEASATPEAT